MTFTNVNEPNNALKFLYIWLLSILIILNAAGQSVYPTTKTQKSTRDTLLFRKQIVPLSLITAGIIIEHLKIKDDIQNAVPRTNTKIENYIQYAPILMLYSSDLFKIKHRNTTFNQAKYLIISELTTSLIVQSLKRITNVERPNGAHYSFPSGHTGNSFVSATVFYKELEDYSNFLALSGYLFSTATGVLRVTNNKHWVPDVLVGAGIGILVTNLVYHFEPLKNWDPFKHEHGIAIVPDIDPEYGSYSLRFCFSLENNFLNHRGKLSNNLHYEKKNT
jgi:membrane-associated phospholipid phosphatase